MFVLGWGALKENCVLLWGASLSWGLLSDEQVTYMEQSSCPKHLPGNPHIWAWMHHGEFLGWAKGERNVHDMVPGLSSTLPSQKSVRRTLWFHSWTHLPRASPRQGILQKHSPLTQRVNSTVGRLHLFFSCKSQNGTEARSRSGEEIPFLGNG